VLHKVVSILDVKASVYMPPQFVVSTGVAIRGFSDAINNSQNPSDLYNHPEDFTMFELGEYDDASAVFNLHQKPKLLAKGSDLSEKVQLPSLSAINN
jgi:hypothetical protein